MITVAVVDDHPHVAIALRALLDKTTDIRLVAEARQGSELMALVKNMRPHVLLLDLLIEPEFDALSSVRDLLQAGVCGYILKDDDYVSQIETIIRNLAAGQLYLSPQAHEALALAAHKASDRELLTEREQDVLRLAVRGLPNPQIAQSLHLSAGTVRNHLSTIYRKLGVHNRHQALEVAEKRGLI